RLAVRNSLPLICHDNVAASKVSWGRDVLASQAAVVRRSYNRLYRQFAPRFPSEKVRHGQLRENMIQNVRGECGGCRTKAMDIIHEKEPRETVGRNTVARFRMQFQPAAYAALEILSGKEIDRVYCDYHDDFV